jgi:peptidoglycan/xylan/chitin deacetylase (PgdA/CDA1 family)
MPKKVYLTFDDAPSIYTNDILDILKEHNAKATFFITGANVAIPDILKRMSDEGHGIQNHGFDHVDMSALDANDVVANIEKCSNLITSTTGDIPKFFRHPFGQESFDTHDACSQLNLQVTSVDRDDIKDWDGRDEGLIYNKVIASMADKRVYMLHDNEVSNVRKALPRILKMLTKCGYTMEVL